MKQKFTPQQIADWRRYEAVRAAGRFNMFSMDAQIMAGLSRERHGFVMDNYDELKKAAERAKQT